MPRGYKAITFEDDRMPFRSSNPAKFNDYITDSRYTLISELDDVKFPLEIDMDEGKNNIYKFDAMKNVEFIIPQFQDEKLNKNIQNIAIYIQRIRLIKIISS